MIESIIIINGDDFGLTEQCSKAIAEAFNLGLISSTTACANGEYLEQAIELAKQNGFIDSVGIHINFTEGKPLTKEIALDPFFCENGAFHYKFDRSQKLTQDQIEEVKEETRAQIERLLSLGCTISHADSHHHVHTCLYFYPQIKEVLKEYGIKKIRILGNIGKIKFIKKLKRNYFNKKYVKDGFNTAKYFGSVGDFSTLKKSNGVCEIMVHPDYNSKGTLIDRLWEEENGEKVGQPLNNIQPLILEKKKISYREL